MTNADWIRGLSDTELAEFLDKVEDEAYKDSSILPKDVNNYPIDMLTWLKMERDGNER